jgi:4'-phosphopantetheinyl transferase
MDPIHRLPPIDPDIPSSSVDLWCFYYCRLSNSGLFAAYENLMTSEEHARYRAFRFERDRLMFLATRALQRTALSAYVDVSPGAWRFAQGEHGKPYIAEPTGLPSLHFNLTNTRGLVVCAISRAHRRLGVDAEWLQRKVDPVELADSHFSSTEFRALRALPYALQSDRFFRYWTLKESYIKARGLGLALPLEQFSFLLDDGPSIRLAFSPELPDHPPRWRCALFAASPCHMLAVSVDTAGTTLALAASSYVPLLGTVPFERSGS